MEPTPSPRRGPSTLALVGLTILGILLGCILGSFLGGAGGFLAGRTTEQRNSQALQQQVTDLQRQLRDAQTRPAAAPTAQATARPSGPAAQATPTRPAGGAQGQTGGTPRATQPAQRTTPGAGGAAQPTPSVYLGVRYNVLTPEIAAQLGITQTQGVLIGEVVPGSPAEKAGFQPGDIITAADGKTLDERYTLADVVTGKKPGDQVQFSVFRDGKTIPITATLAAPPAGAFNTPTPGGVAPSRPAGGTPQATPAAPRPSGGTATPSRPSGGTPGPTPRAPSSNVAPPAPSANVTTARAYLGVQVTAASSGNGALIEMVMPASAAFRAGLFDGDVILAVDGAPVDANHSLTTLLAAKKPGDKVTLRVQRAGQAQPEDVSVTLGATTREFNQGQPGLP